MDTPFICTAISLFLSFFCPTSSPHQHLQGANNPQAEHNLQNVDSEIDSWADENPVFSYWAEEHIPEI